MVLLAAAFLAIAVSIQSVAGGPHHHDDRGHPPHGHHHHHHKHHHDKMSDKVYELMCENEEFNGGIKTCLDGITDERAKVVISTCSLADCHSGTTNSEDLLKEMCADKKYALKVHLCTAMLFPLVYCDNQTNNDSSPVTTVTSVDLDDSDDGSEDNSDDGSKDNSDDGSDESDDDDEDDDEDQEEDRSRRHKGKSHHHHHDHHRHHHLRGPFGHNFGANQECFNQLYEKFNLTSSRDMEE